MDFDKNKKAESVNLRATSDEGIGYIEVTIEKEDGYFFYIDVREDSKTYEEIFANYPKDLSEKPLEMDSILSKTIKRLYKQNEKA